jgi:hypothetical protein
MAFAPKLLIEGNSPAGRAQRDSYQEKDEVTATRLKRSAESGRALVVGKASKL